LLLELPLLLRHLLMSRFFLVSSHIHISRFSRADSHLTLGWKLVLLVEEPEILRPLRATIWRKDLWKLTSTHLAGSGKASRSHGLHHHLEEEVVLRIGSEARSLLLHHLLVAHHVHHKLLLLIELHRCIALAVLITIQGR